MYFPYKCYDCDCYGSITTIQQSIFIYLTIIRYVSVHYKSNVLQKRPRYRVNFILKYHLSIITNANHFHMYLIKCKHKNDAIMCILLTITTFDNLLIIKLFLNKRKTIRKITFRKAFSVCYNWKSNLEKLGHLTLIHISLLGGVVCCFSTMHVSRSTRHRHSIINKRFSITHLANELMLHLPTSDFVHVVVLVINSYRCVPPNIVGPCWEKIDTGLEKTTKAIFIFTPVMTNETNDHHPQISFVYFIHSPQFLLILK